MDNLEEVLQALDEFQKVRPSEIPRELEDYLCWVAKTGDPVYQWSLIKTLFREKLTRVMTEFYESCPTLDLAPCPNVEHFNYDMMKSNLLERLESFANAPFTVQRICELLTAPRKEYNRVDKFMRAIEKNILVVSTREPGPITRRNENGDGMVNGSVDEDPSVTQPPQDVEMEYWEKDCSSTVTISVHTVENETPLLHTVVPTNTVVKNVFDTEELSHEKVESTSKSDIVVSNFIQTTSEFSGVSNLNSQAQTQDSQIGSAIQNLSTIVPENSGIISDVSEAIMNEDTSSQPSLELINEGDAVDSSRKLQTTFQTKDFSTNENKSTKFYIDNSKINEKTEVELMSIHVQEGSNKSKDILVKSDIELKTVLDNKESVSPIVENLNTNKNLENAIKLDTGVENIQSIIDTSTSNKKSLDVETSTTNNSEQLTNNLILSTDNISTEETINTSENLSVDIENLKDQTKEVELIKNSKSIIEESCSKTNITKHFNQNQKKNDLTITEIGEDEGSIIKTIVPDPIPIVEEPKNIESIKIKENISPIEITEKSENLQNSPIICQSENKETISIKDSNVAQLQGNNITSTINKIHDSDTVIENIMNKKEQKEVELMDVDEEETLSVFQQDDEVMEQETVQSSRS